MLFIKSLDYEENWYNEETQSNSLWAINGLKLDQFNLITGLNSAGKTRVCRIIKNTITTIRDSNAVLKIGTTKIEFKTSPRKTYRLEIDVVKEGSGIAVKKEILNELKAKQEKIMFNRKKIFDSVRKKYLEYNPPNELLTFRARRDKKYYPYLEKIINATNDFYFFDIDEPQMVVTIGHRLDKISHLYSEVKPSDLPFYFQKSIEKKQKKDLFNDLSSLGYYMEDMFVKEVKLAGTEIPMLYFKEKGVKGIYPYRDISTGMRNVIFLVVCLYLVKKGDCLLIDNVGDGLDYSRSKKIIEILEEKAKDKQVILCTNNEILLNQTDLRNWNVLSREGSTVTAYNYRNNKENILKFANSGLSNYEFFKDQYYEVNS